MALIDNELLNLDVNIDNSNSIKDMILSRLEDDGVITPEKAKEYSEKWQVIIIKKSWFSRWSSIFFNKEEANDCYIFKYVKFED
jgi:hypothetical protein